MQVKAKDGTTTQPGVTPSAGQAGTPTPPQTYTQADLDKTARDAKSAALAEVGRFKAESDRAIKAAQAAQERMNQMIAEQDRRELEEAQGDPQRLSALQERQGRRKAESELAEVKTKLAQEEEWHQQTEAGRAEDKRTQIVQETATRFNVDPVRLARLAKATDGSPEAIEDLAKDLPTGTPKSSLRPDSGGAIGGHLDRKQVIDAYIKNPRDLKVRAAYFELRREEGR